MNYNGNYSYKHQGQALVPSSLPPPRKYKPRESCEKNLYTSEIQDKRTTSKSKPLIVLLLVKPNISEGVEPLTLVTCQGLEDEIPKKPRAKVPLPITIVLGGSLYEGDQAIRGTSRE